MLGSKGVTLSEDERELMRILHKLEQKHKQAHEMFHVLEAEAFELWPGDRLFMDIAAAGLEVSKLIKRGRCLNDNYYTLTDKGVELAKTLELNQ